jgi:Ca2+-transporting ATPase
LPLESGPSQLALFAEQFQTLPVALLVTSSVLSLATRSFLDAVATLSVVGANAVLGYVTEAQAEAAIHKLMDTRSTSAQILRDGQEIRLAPNDWFRAMSSRCVPDSRRPPTSASSDDTHLKVDESALTGETLPVTKSGLSEVTRTAPVGERPTMLHSGTIVVEGTAQGRRRLDRRSHRHGGDRGAERQRAATARSGRGRTRRPQRPAGAPRAGGLRRLLRHRPDARRGRRRRS